MSQPNFDSQDFYEVLGVPRNSSDKDIKKAYRKLSLKYHPDKNPNNQQQAEEIFKKVSFAYGILSDQKKKQDYDQFGRDYVINGGHTNQGGGHGGGNFNFQSFGGQGGQGGGGDFGHFNMQSADEIFRNFFGGQDPFASFFDDDDDMFGGSGFGNMGGFGQMQMGRMHDNMGFGQMGMQNMQMGGNGHQRDQKFGRQGRAQTNIQKNNRMGGMGMGFGFDDDDFFGGGLGGGMSNFSSFQSSSFGGMGGMGGGMGESVQKETTYVNGQQKTITRKTTMQNGQTHTEVIEESMDPRTGQSIRNQYIESSGGQQPRQIQGGSRKHRK